MVPRRLQQISVVIVSLSFSMTASAANQIPKSPWNELQKVTIGDYFAPYSTLKTKESEYRTSPQKNDFLQAMATLLSYVGRYVEAQSYFDEMASQGSDVQAPDDLSALKAQDAVPAIIRAVSDRQVVMINEAHHVPETRGITFALLKPLYDKGFRYLAAETFQEFGLEETRKAGYPIRTTGYYTADPLFADMVREAMRIGFTLVAYEHVDECDYSAESNDCQDRRERGQARNLIDRVLKKDPRAKILIHAGYGHIDETGGSYNFPWTPMAKCFKELSGIDPLTVDQTTFRAHNRVLIEEKSYRRLLASFRVKGPAVLENKTDGTLWSAMNGHYDVQVILPAHPSDRERPQWLMELVGRRETRVDLGRCKGFPCLVQAIARQESAGGYNPYDQFVFANGKERPILWLRPGDFILKFISKRGTGEVGITIGR